MYFFPLFFFLFPETFGFSVRGLELFQPRELLFPDLKSEGSPSASPGHGDPENGEREVKSSPTPW